MFCLVYTSKANADFGLQKVQEMLVKARDSNAQQNITGCLLYFNERFIQYLEGDEITVKELYAKIEEDSRHSEVKLLSQSRIHNREFITWRMAFEHLKSENSDLQYLKLLVATFFENPENSLSPNPTSIEFWNATKLLLTTKYADKSA
ncbi:BLUF domain-containing protein [Zobellia uliginosa]|uniref:BLUF domain-containing protein n=1 Tax=Zobellia uliginosa TaxID=143224 RepID=UPI001C079E68|nr:BLUF domain-containing protein [Zobellia uliginosa]MBU2945197.1 BLUF domain-containing protein [Zobellia uliginosa]